MSIHLPLFSVCSQTPKWFILLSDALCSWENKIFQFSQTLQKSFETIHSVPTYLKIGQHDLQINKLAATVPNLYRQKKKKKSEALNSTQSDHVNRCYKWASYFTQKDT